ncbi:unnamed protein product [Didymodactylos carnosus]|uniref:Major facilitator superfamily (MFS) profile domain-containing protein n=1 Tax=Didymodactylos carnosus TaxID=1234261 RepID=A0A814MJJ2_9BILA|nr:unnamed protein product [Didymodactylos carnosus]CAF1080213.1 unnamed protein product [Didymodactylos carnosus]CAF3751909.1 unnamed protein product [Didymodactylos carnosus]CAF3846252.1 unnamed protein product [Didymodactylos carnosus]
MNKVRFCWCSSLKLRPSLPLAVAIVAHLSMRFSGINGIMYYSTALFERANIGKNSSYATIGVGFTSILMTILSGYLMDRAGRRTLHLIGLTGTFICSVLITITFIFAHLADWLKYFSITFVFAFVTFVGLGPGNVPWVIVPEIFAQGARPAATSVAMVTNWLSNFTVGLIFPLLADNIPHYVFLPFAIMTLLATLFLYKYLPETKKRTFEEITMSFRSHMRQNTKQLQSDSNNYQTLDIA